MFFFFSSSSFIYTWKETCILHFERATTGPSKCFARSIKTFPCVCSGLCPENFMALDETLVKILCCSMRRSQADHNKDWTNVGHGNCVFWAWACHFWCHRVMHAFVTCNIHAPKLRPDCSTSVHCKKVFFFLHSTPPTINIFAFAAGNTSPLSAVFYIVVYIAHNCMDANYENLKRLSKRQWWIQS